MPPPLPTPGARITEPCLPRHASFGWSIPRQSPGPLRCDCFYNKRTDGGRFAVGADSIASGMAAAALQRAVKARRRTLAPSRVFHHCLSVAAPSSRLSSFAGLGMLLLSFRRGRPFAAAGLGLTGELAALLRGTAGIRAAREMAPALPLACGRAGSG